MHAGCSGTWMAWLAKALFPPRPRPLANMGKRAMPIVKNIKLTSAKAQRLLLNLLPLRHPAETLVICRCWRAMICAMHFLLALCGFFVSTEGMALHIRAEPQLSNATDEESGPEGHLTEPWVVAVAVTLAVMISIVAIIIFIVKRRQARRRGSTRDHTLTLGQNRVERQQLPPRPFHGPYGFSAAASRRLSPPSPAHARLSEKAAWMLLPPQR
ncbi:hypothetical protein BD414DRAFT_318781 [Trametes punicea]|nr:hypothetical protein BD414DRAFT_318781 [Trametes punicea]